MKTFILLLLLSSAQLFSQEILVNDPPSPIAFVSQPFDVLHYDADINLMKAPLSDMSGICTTTLTWKQGPAGDCYFFNLMGLTVDSVFFNGVKTTVTPYLEPSSPSYSYCVTPSTSVKKGDTSFVKIYYSGKMSCESGGNSGWCGGVTSSNSILYALGVGFFANYVSTTRHWLPCYDHPSDKATYHARFKVKTGMTVASNGIGSSSTQGDTVIYDWVHNIPCATYLYTFAVSNYFPLSFGTDELPMVVYSKASDTVNTRKSFKLLPRMVSTFEKLYGKFPFEKVGYVNTTTGAMEHETMISFPTFLSQRGDSVNSTASHELAHQWFGDAVSPEDFRHAWLTESPATFSETIWAEELRGRSGYITAQNNNLLDYFSAAKTEGIFALYDFPRTKPSSNYPATIYNKGAVVLGMLRYELGDSLFFKSLQTYIERYKYSTATTALFEQKFEEVSGKNLAWFFNQWVYRKGWVVLNVGYSRVPVSGGDSVVRVSVHQVQTPDSLYIHVPIEMTFFKGKDTVSTVVKDLSSKDTTFVLGNIGEFTSMTINQGPTVRAMLQVSKITGIDENELPKGMQDLRIIPNPAGSEFQLVLSVLTDCNASLTVSNSVGETVLTKIVPLHIGTASYSFDSKNFASGAYSLKLATPFGVYSSQLSIVK